MQQMTSKIQNEEMHMYKHSESNLIFQPAPVAIHLNTRFSHTFFSIQVRTHTHTHTHTHIHIQGDSGKMTNILGGNSMSL